MISKYYDAMSLENKIVLNFFISVFLLISLSCFEYINGQRIKEEMRSLEVTDTIRSKSLQLIRHEKNFFLYTNMAEQELSEISKYINELNDIIAKLDTHNTDVAQLKNIIMDYHNKFDSMINDCRKASKDYLVIKAEFIANDIIAQCLGSGILNRPDDVATMLINTFSVPNNHQFIASLRQFQQKVEDIRKTGEELLVVSKKMDNAARESIERYLALSQFGILVVLPVFLFIGLGLLSYTSNNILKKIFLLTEAVGKLKKRYAGGKNDTLHKRSTMDEIDLLLDEFHSMEEQIKTWEEELKKSNRQLMESRKLAAIGSMASGVAHELNNPLNNIFLSAQILKKNISPDTSAAIQESTEDILSETMRVKAIVSQLLEFAKEKTLRLKRIDLKELIERSYHLTFKTIQVESITFSLEMSEPVEIEADEGMLERVFVNLFSNAVAAMENRGRLVVSIERINQYVKICVLDTGKGMTENEKAKAFDPFFTQKENGNGLGLAIVMNIIKKHHGDISVESEKDMGTVFEITLPLSQIEIGE